MPYCGRCLNVGKAGKRGAPPEYGPTSTVVCLLRQAQPTPNRASIGNDDRGYYRLCQEPCEREMRRTTFMPSCSFMKTCQTGRRRAPPW